MLKIKTAYLEDIRMFRFEGEGKKCYSALMDFARNVYHLKQPFTLQYRDTEKDLVTVASTQDLMDAFECAKENKQTLKVFVTVSKTEAPIKNKEKGSVDVDVKESGEKSPECSEMKEELILRDEEREFGADIMSDDFSLSNGAHVDQSQLFVKKWMIKNTGKRTWLEGTKVVYHGKKDNPLIAQTEFAVKTPVKPGDNVEVSVVVRVPGAPGHYSCNWRFMTPQGTIFGQKLSFTTFIHGEYVD